MADEDQVHIVAGPRVDGGFFAIMHRGEDKVRSILGRSYAELHRRIASAGIGEFGMAQDDANEMAASTVSRLHDGAEAEQDPANATSDSNVEATGAAIAQIAELEAKLKDAQDEIEVLKTELGQASDAAASRGADVERLKAEIDAQATKLADAENQIAALQVGQKSSEGPQTPPKENPAAGAEADLSSGLPPQTDTGADAGETGDGAPDGGPASSGPEAGSAAAGTQGESPEASPPQVSAPATEA